jgi:hypothetical protein
MSNFKEQEQEQEQEQVLEESTELAQDLYTLQNSCLVLCIEERTDDNYNQIDTRLFVTYDFVEDTFVLYGKRENKQDEQDEHDGHLLTHFKPFFFRFFKKQEIYNCIEFLISRESNCSYTLYNYDNMPYNCDTVNYDDLADNMNYNYELVMYDDVKIRRRRLLPILSTIRKAFNFF